MIEPTRESGVSTDLARLRAEGSHAPAAELIADIAKLDSTGSLQLADELSGGVIFDMPTMTELPSGLDILLPAEGRESAAKAKDAEPVARETVAIDYDLLENSDEYSRRMSANTPPDPATAAAHSATTLAADAGGAQMATSTRISSRRAPVVDALLADAAARANHTTNDDDTDDRDDDDSDDDDDSTGPETITANVDSLSAAPEIASAEVVIHCAHCLYRFSPDLPSRSSTGTFQAMPIACPSCGHLNQLRDVEESIDDDDSAPMLIGAVTTATGAEKGDAWIGKVVGRCRLKRKIGQGGMGSVYLALHEVLERDRAVKLLPRKVAGDRKAADRFIQEARLTARLEHPNILAVYDVGQEHDNFFIVMQFADGGSLSRLLRKRGRLRFSYALRMAEQIASGLECAHNMDVVHRDVKPDNIMLMTDGTAKVGDFGLAKNTGFGADITQAGLIMGSPAYMSPEQCDGRDVDHRSDIYSLGITLFQMICGRRPFQGATPLAMMLMHQSEDAPPPSSVIPELPPYVDELVLRMLEKDKHDRQQNMGEVLADIRAALRRYEAEKPMRVALRRATADTLFGLVALQDYLLTSQQMSELLKAWHEAREQYGDPPGLAQLARQRGDIELEAEQRASGRVRELMAMGIDPPPDMLERMVTEGRAGSHIPLPEPLPPDAVAARRSQSDLAITPTSVARGDRERDRDAGGQDIALIDGSGMHTTVIPDWLRSDGHKAVPLDRDEFEAAQFDFIQLQSDLRDIYRSDDNPVCALALFQEFAQKYARTSIGHELRDYHQKLVGKVAAACDRVGLKLMQKNQLDEAIRWFDEALTHDTHSAMVWNNRGIAQMRRGNLGAAMRDFQQALEREPLAMVFYNQGQVLRRLQKLKEAEAAYLRCIELDPSHDKAWCNLGGVRFTRKDFSGALKDFERALELNPKNAEALAGRGKIFRRQGEHGKAREEFERLVELAPDNARFQSSLADALLDEGKLDDAKRCYKQA
ncbi:MAG: protein kinase, partial [Planctomycetota bacterium]